MEANAKKKKMLPFGYFIAVKQAHNIRRQSRASVVVCGLQSMRSVRRNQEREENVCYYLHKGNTHVDMDKVNMCSDDSVSAVCEGERERTVQLQIK